MVFKTVLLSVAIVVSVFSPLKALMAALRRNALACPELIGLEPLLARHRLTEAETGQVVLSALKVELSKVRRPYLFCFVSSFKSILAYRGPPPHAYIYVMKTVGIFRPDVALSEQHRIFRGVFIFSSCVPVYVQLEFVAL